MEDIREKAHQDELNKSNEDIGKSPDKFIGIPQPKKKQKSKIKKIWKP